MSTKCSAWLHGSHCSCWLLSKEWSFTYKYTMAEEILCSLMYLLTAVAQPLQTILPLTRSQGPRLSSMRSSNVAPSSIIQKALNMLGLSRKGLKKSKAAELDFRGWWWVSTERSLSQLSCCYAAAAVALPPLLKCWRQISPPLPLIYTMCFKPL